MVPTVCSDDSAREAWQQLSRNAIHNVALQRPECNRQSIRRAHRYLRSTDGTKMSMLRAEQCMRKRNACQPARHAFDAVVVKVRTTGACLHDGTDGTQVSRRRCGTWSWGDPSMTDCVYARGPS